MPEFVLILIRALFSFVILLIMTRLMGKTQLSQLTFFDYVVGITIGSIAASVSIDQNIKALNGIIGILVWGLLPILLAWLSLKSYRFGQLVEGQPLVLIERGKVLEQNMKKARLTPQELMMMLRQNNAFKLTDVEFAVLETNGRLSVLKKTSAEPVTPKQLNLPTAQEREPRVVILDGNVMEKTLGRTGYTQEWLLREIKKQGAKRFSDVYLAQLTGDGSLYVDLYKDRKKRGSRLN